MPVKGEKRATKTRSLTVQGGGRPLFTERCDIYWTSSPVNIAPFGLPLTGSPPDVQLARRQRGASTAIGAAWRSRRRPAPEFPNGCYGDSCRACAKGAPPGRTLSTTRLELLVGSGYVLCVFWLCSGYVQEVVMSDPVRVLAIAIIRQALVDYQKGPGRRKRDAERFLRGEGRKLWIVLGFKEEHLDEFLDEFLERPNEVGYTQLAGRQPRR